MVDSLAFSSGQTWAVIQTLPLTSSCAPWASSLTSLTSVCLSVKWGCDNTHFTSLLRPLMKSCF